MDEIHKDIHTNNPDNESRTKLRVFSALGNAAVTIQKAVRGRRGGIKYKESMEGIPHTMVIGLETATGLQLNNDFLQSQPNTYILANLIRRNVMKSGRIKEHCFSSHASKVAYLTTSPCYAEDIKVTSTAVGTLVLSIMSHFTIGSDTFHGQVSLNIEDYKDLSNGGIKVFRNSVIYPRSYFHKQNSVGYRQT